MSVWETLGIEKTEDERAIKRAYAKQLKSIRPDEDASHFQTLREARDEAIFIARYDDDYTWDDELDEEQHNELEEGFVETEPDEERSNEEAPVEGASVMEAPVEGEPTIGNPYTNESSHQDKSHEENKTNAPLKDVYSREEAVSEQNDIVKEEDYTLTIDEIAPLNHHSTETLNESAVDKNNPDTSTESSELIESEIPQEQEWHQDQPKDISPDQMGFFEANIDDINYEHIDAQIEDLMGPWNIWDLKIWEKFINKARECSFDISNYAEYEVLNAIAENLELKNPEQEQKKQSRKVILTLLNVSYGWTQNDRRVYAILPDSQAERLMNYLRGVDIEELDIPSAEYYDRVGFPRLSKQNFKDYLGKNNTIYEQYYEDCLDNNKTFHLSWSWPGFLFSSFWLAHRCNDGLESLSGISYIIALLALNHGLQFPGSPALPLAIIFMIFLQFLIGFYGKRLVITTMASTFTDLEENKSLTDEEKLKKLASVGRAGVRGISDFLMGMLGLGVIGIIIYSLIF